MRKAVEFSVAVALGVVGIVAPAMAGLPLPATPAPVLGLGIPAVALFGLAYRKLRNRGED